MNRAEIIAALAGGPKTNRELGELFCESGGYVARTMARLRHAGRVERDIVLGKATYRLSVRQEIEIMREQFRRACAVPFCLSAPE